MLWDMGLSQAKMDDSVAVDQKIKEIENRFNLVLIAER
jgi:hypothetical protein